MAGKQQQQNKVERVAVLVVHGVGEQKRFEHLEVIATNLYQALTPKKVRSPVVQIHYGQEVPHLSSEHSWREAPVSLRWRKPDGSWIEVQFREVHWADLDMVPTISRWFRFVGWSLSVAGVRLYSSPKVGAPEKHEMCPPKAISIFRRLWVRAQLLLVSLGKHASTTD